MEKEKKQDCGWQFPKALKAFADGKTKPISGKEAGGGE